MVRAIKTEWLNVIITVNQMTKSPVQISGTFLIPKIKTNKLILQYQSPCTACQQFLSHVA
jgi:hypothetical protein